MPLVVMCGFPCSGKTRRCEELVSYLEQHHPDRSVHVVRDEVDETQSYSSSKEEKMLRGSHKSKVERLLSKDSVVILDSLNYIKGYRYELYCVSKHLSTTHCVLWCNVSADKAQEWNSKGTPGYSPDLLDALVMRFEQPDSRNRWDSPLFVVCPGDLLPASDICAALFQRKPPAPNQSTQSQPLSESSFLHELDRMTQEVVRTAMDAQRNDPAMSGPVAISGSEEKLLLPGPTSLVELRRLRKQYIAYTKQHPVDTSTTNITTLFVQYINKTIL